MNPLPTWMRRALFATAAMNILAAAGFLPGATSVRALAGLPEGGHPLYLLTVAMFVLLFGLGYLGAATAGRADRLFITVAAVGKLSFFTLLVAFWARGAVPFRAPVLGSADLIFGTLFAVWLVGSGSSA
jgi:hypothetical protein